MDATAVLGGGRVRLFAVLVTVVTALGLLAVPASDRGAAQAWIVDVGTALPAAAQVVQQLPLIDAVVVTSPVPIRGGIPADTPLRTQSLQTAPVEGDAPSQTSADDQSAGAGSDEVDGAVSPADVRGSVAETGGSAVVALIDTGVAPVPSLLGSMAGEIDFTGTGGGDGYGHGTFLASIIAGDGGVAPDAGILSLKVGDAEGNSTLGAVLTALQWLNGPGRSAGIRVATLALAIERGTDAAVLLDRAVDRLAHGGVLVVTASGNDGPDVLTSPATAVGSFSVGATDLSGLTAWFSGSGPDNAGIAQPDLRAPGVSVVGSLPEGSVIAAEATQLADGLYSGTGTSMATALTAGVAALASSSRPDLDGPALDAALREGGGTLDAAATVGHAVAAPAAPGRSGTPGSGAVGNANGVGNGNGSGDGSADPQSIRWTSIRWTSIRWTGAGWGDETWGVATWGSIRWTGGSWAYADAQPQSIRWTSIRWTWLP